jgi:hypothetical protein
VSTALIPTSHHACDALTKARKRACFMWARVPSPSLVPSGRSPPPTYLLRVGRALPHLSAEVKVPLGRVRAVNAGGGVEGLREAYGFARASARVE